MRIPLLVHLVFHPKSEAARALALELHKALNDDPALPGLRIPTVMVPEDGTDLPPLDYRLDEAERSLVVVLADDEMVLEPATLPEGRQTWAQSIFDLWQQCETTKHRFVPVQLSPSAWPLDARLSGTNFLRTVLQPDASKARWTTRAVIVELCRFIEGKERGGRLPVQLFLSHAKQDINAPPKVFNAIVEHLEATQPVQTWIDSAKIEAGSEFGKVIEDAVKKSIVLVLATKSYNGRPWCKKELLFTKRYQRPFIVIEALEDLDLRAFPYAGNAPRLRWSDGGAERAVDLVLKETLRYMHARLLLERQKRPDDFVMPTPPELATVVELPRGQAVLYPDPPLGDEEVEALAPLGLHVQTPLQRAAEGLSLKQMPILLSISESGDLARYGMTSKHLDAALYEISRQLLVRGATLEYGGHLGSEGYTMALFDMVRSYASLSGLPPAERIVNDVGWPLPLQTLPAATRAAHQYVATYRRIPRPDGVEQLEPSTFVAEPKFFPANTPERRFAWARGMTTMREFQVQHGKARIVLGGTVGPTLKVTPEGKREEKWYSGRIPGVVEEAFLSMKAGQPVYLVGAFGGAAALVIDLLEGRTRADFTWDYHKQAPHSEAMRELYQKKGIAWEDYEDISLFFRAQGVKGLSETNGLSEEQNCDLFQSRDVYRIVELLLEGLTHRRPQANGS